MATKKPKGDNERRGRERIHENAEGEAPLIHPIVVDCDGPASLRFPNFTANFLSVKEAVDQWHKLPAKDREHTVLVLHDQRVYQPGEIPRLRVTGTEG